MNSTAHKISHGRYSRNLFRGRQKAVFLHLKTKINEKLCQTNFLRVLKGRPCQIITFSPAFGTTFFPTHFLAYLQRTSQRIEGKCRVISCLVKKVISFYFKPRKFCVYENSLMNTRKHKHKQAENKDIIKILFIIYTRKKRKLN